MPGGREVVLLAAAAPLAAAVGLELHLRLVQECGAAVARHSAPRAGLRAEFAMAAGELPLTLGASRRFAGLAKVVLATRLPLRSGLVVASSACRPHRPPSIVGNEWRRLRGNGLDVGDREVVVVDHVELPPLIIPDRPLQYADLRLERMHQALGLLLALLLDIQLLLREVPLLLGALALLLREPQLALGGVQLLLHVVGDPLPGVLHRGLHVGVAPGGGRVAPGGGRVALASVPARTLRCLHRSALVLEFRNIGAELAALLLRRDQEGVQGIPLVPDILELADGVHGGEELPRPARAELVRVVAGRRLQRVEPGRQQPLLRGALLLPALLALVLLGAGLLQI
mmetsp:Transcript_111793/g.316510  ORF Transcript_111793/g.316510 Transcript_111793/m.316510 type:complete len:342 (-) Transcript_111793:811-1836(-)